MIPYGHQTIDQEDVDAVVKVLRSDWLTQGPAVASFEKALADYCGAKYAVAFANGTAALHSAYYAAGLSADDEFITSPLTFAATANAGLYVGARPVFVDCNEQGLIDPKLIENKITSKTKLLSVIDYAGQPADLDALRAIAKKHNLVLVEDACHALGASYKEKKIGSISDLSVFSFHPVKPITTGEGGAVLTDNEDYYKRLQLFRTHGITKDAAAYKQPSPGEWYHEMQDLGYNYRLTDLQAALGESQLKKLDRFTVARQKIVGWYQNNLKDASDYLELPVEAKDTTSSWHLYVVKLRGNLVAKKPAIFAALRQAGIGVQVHYIPVHQHPYYQQFGYKIGDYPVAEKFYEAAITLPLYPNLAESEVHFIADTLKTSIKSYVA